jgi:hypothetical protein
LCQQLNQTKQTNTQKKKKRLKPPGNMNTGDHDAIDKSITTGDRDEEERNTAAAAAAAAATADGGDDDNDNDTSGRSENDSKTARLCRAAEAVLHGRQRLTKAARAEGSSRWVLRRAIAKVRGGRAEGVGKRGRPHLLTSEQEAHLRQWVHKAEHHGRPLLRCQIQEQVRKLAGPRATVTRVTLARLLRRCGCRVLQQSAEAAAAAVRHGYAASAAAAAAIVVVADADASTGCNKTQP